MSAVLIWTATTSSVLDLRWNSKRAETSSGFSVSHIHTMGSLEETPVKHAGVASTGFDGQVNAAPTLSTSPLPGQSGQALVQEAVQNQELLHSKQDTAMASILDKSSNFPVEGLVLFDLTAQPGSKSTFSPHCIKTVVDLRILAVTGYERARLSFAQIRNDLENKIGHPGVTVPTLELGDGSHLTDSWTIAEVSQVCRTDETGGYGRVSHGYCIPPPSLLSSNDSLKEAILIRPCATVLCPLYQFLEENHPLGHLLFPSTTAKRLASFINELGRSLLAPHLGALSIPKVAELLDAESEDYFIHRKVGTQRFNKLAGLSEQERDTHVQGAIKVLGVIEAALTASPARVEASSSSSPSSSSTSRWLAGTQEPSHADACLYGWYVYTRAAGPVVTRSIWSSAHPRIAAWVVEMNRWAGDEVTKDFLP